MIPILFYPLSFAAVIWALFDPVWAWSILIIQAVLLGAQFIGIKSKKIDYTDDLSAEANEQLRKYTHLYTLPTASQGISSSLSACAFASIIVGLIGVLNGFWTGLAIAVVYAFITDRMAKLLVPPAVYNNASSFKEIDGEIRDWMNNRSNKGQSDKNNTKEPRPDKAILAEKYKSFSDELKLKGSYEDQISNGYGPFGLTKTNPIPTTSPTASVVYLSQLRLSNGEQITYERIGSTSAAEVTEGMIDMYKISVNGEKITTLYFCPYHNKLSIKTPDGFELAGV
jgi:hypothetical protein